ncbi:MAG: AraC family transcriptional regulator ligand-binding domain-containing protein [Pseudomonadota bacterium]
MTFHNYSLERRAIRAGQVVALVRQLEGLGIAPELALEGTGLTLAQLEDPEARVSYRQRIRQLDNLVALVPPGDWLAWPGEISISDFGLLGYAMMSSATLEKAVLIAVKYHKMAGAMFELSFLRDGDDAVLRIDHMLAGGRVGEYVVDDLFRGIGPLITLLTRRPFSPRVVHLARPRPAWSEKYGAVFDCPVRFDERYSEYRFDAACLAEPLAEADANTARICEESCRKLLNQMEIEEGLVSRICHLLLSTPGDFPLLPVTATQLGLSPRTLRRRLALLGTSYQKILDDVKKELAIEYLLTTDLTIQEIADLVGYTEVTNFRRAFVKWTRMSPYAYRRRYQPAEVEASYRSISAR